ncbi:hypothetical protein MNEG_10075 [Monoraphidium neglectum]|uniref:Uncharacterized protein n=1 Tax=Monoraphidium neglectum TaxID=145388 RepID=A0A0D2MTX2_9CHLO|nr:hypothetical protein MNEG_10075 [Monoraphidium neglectum]KIY97890.1 hypothetical protein MNEG_10075 [Monoraphidium neglectum]|eukprot:XP_013896910.1 hypothetical protein MNEG_10075 [Monoraphidium neglectum]
MDPAAHPAAVPGAQYTLAGAPAPGHAHSAAAAAHAAAHGSAHAAPLNPLDLDRLFHEGDDRTWDMEEWSWDPSELVAAPNGVPTLNPCQVGAP